MAKRRSKPLKALREELGMDQDNWRDLREDSLKVLKHNFDDLYNVLDEQIEPVAFQFLNSPKGTRYFSSNVEGITYQWDVPEHRPYIFQYMNEIMQTQRWYAIDAMHQRVPRTDTGEVDCPGCLIHQGMMAIPKNMNFGDAHHPIDLGYSSDGTSVT